MTNYCTGCGRELKDVNQGYSRLQYDHPYYVCPNRDCEKSPYYRQEPDIDTYYQNKIFGGLSALQTGKGKIT